MIFELFSEDVSVCLRVCARACAVIFLFVGEIISDYYSWSIEVIEIYRLISNISLN